MARPKRKLEAVEGESPKETKEQKMLRLGNKRVEAALTKIRLIGNLAAYKPTGQQVDQIMEALGGACAKVDARLRGARTDSYTFRLQ